MPNCTRSEKPKSPVPAGVVKIEPAEVALPKEQQSFNRLVAQIENLQKKIKTDTAKMDELLNVYHKEVTPVIRESGSLQIEFCRLLDESRKRIKLPGNMHAAFNTMIKTLITEAIVIMSSRDANADKLYKKYFGQTVEERQQQLRDEAKSFFSSASDDERGAEYNASNTDETSAGNAGKQKPPKKTKKQLEREALEKRKLELKNKSIRGVYLSLAKILHPDSEPDENLKTEKEELMKLATSAYKDRDMFRLLELEMQFVRSHQDHLAQLDKETLSAYLQLLRDQVSDLESEHFMLFRSPTYAPVGQYRHGTIKRASDHIKSRASGHKQRNNALRNDIAALQAGKNEMAIIKKHLAAFEDDDEFPF